MKRLLSWLLLSLLLGGVASVARAQPGDVAPGTAAGSAWCPAQRDGRVTVADALIALRRALSLVSSIGCGLGDWSIDVAPGVPLPAPGGGLAQWKPTPDGLVNAADALVLLRAAVGLIRLEPANADYRTDLGTLPAQPALGDRDVFPGDPFPDEFAGDVDCNLNGAFDGPAEVRLRTVVGLAQPPTVPFEVCLWMREDATAWDFDAPPFGGSFPGPEDVDGDGDGLFANPPPRPADACSVVCPEGFSAPGITCATTESAGGHALIVEVGPVFATEPVETIQEWSAVVDPFHRLADETFADNVPGQAPALYVAQCPPVAADLVPRPSAVPIIQPAAPSQFDPISFHFEVANVGDASAVASFWSDVFIDYAGVFPPVPGPFGPFPPTSRSCAEVVIPPGERFDPGESVALAFSQFVAEGGDCVAGGGPLLLPPGLHDFRALVDSTGSQPGNPPGTGGAIHELDEGNNLFPQGASTAEGRFCVGSGRGLGSPDLAITRVRFFEPGSSEEACHREVGDVVDVQVEFQNLADLAGAKDLGISKGFENFRYALAAPSTALDGFEFDCVPVGALQAPLRGRVTQNLGASTLQLSLAPTPALPPLPAAPPDLSPGNNAVTVPMLNAPPVVSAGPDRAGAVNVNLAIDASASDPNDVPAGSQPLAILWSVTSQPAGSKPLLGNPTVLDTTFRADVPGRYTLRLEARDCGASGFVAADTMNVDLAP